MIKEKPVVADAAVEHSAARHTRADNCWRKPTGRVGKASKGCNRG